MAETEINWRLGRSACLAQQSAAGITTPLHNSPELTPRRKSGLLQAAITYESAEAHVG